MGNVKRSAGERIFDAVNLTFLTLFAFICLYPFIYILALSFNDGVDAMKGGVYFLPRQFTLDNYQTIFKDKRLLNSLGVTVFRTVAGTVLGVICNTLYAYAISKPDLPYRKVLNWLLVIPMYFGSSLIPYYIICQHLHLINNIWVYVIPWAVTPFHIMLLRIAVKELPPSLEESAELDGASYPVIFIQIILPLIVPAIATVALLSGLFHWNDWFDGTVMTNKSTLWPLQTLLLNIIQGADMSSFMKTGHTLRKVSITTESVKMAMLVFTVLPIFMIYPFAQKYFIRGMMVGSVKE